MDDLDAVRRNELLRDAYSALNVFGKEDDSEAQQVRFCYLLFKDRLRELAQRLPDESAYVYGMVCYILSSALCRANGRVFKFILEKIELANIVDSTESIQRLRAEEDLIRIVYKEFCELVLPGMMGDQEAVDFGDVVETEIEDVPPAASQDGSPKLEKIFPEEQNQRSYDTVVTAFLDQVRAAFESSAERGVSSIGLRIGLHGVSVSVGAYSGPSKSDPACPLVLRISMHGLRDPSAQKQLGLQPAQMDAFNGQIELSLLPKEILAVSGWAEEWIKGQLSPHSTPPHMPIDIDGSGIDSENWREVDYVWSTAARAEYQKWEKGRKSDEN